MTDRASVIHSGPEEIAAFRASLDALPNRADSFAVEAVHRILSFAEMTRASDVHLLPLGDQRLQLRFRWNGVLEVVGELPHSASNVIARLKVLSELLTYKSDVPQEGRVRLGASRNEIRVSTFPTVHGEKAVARLFIGSSDLHLIADLGYPDDIETWLRHRLKATSGVLLVCGPAGSGKTTTVYAALRELVQKDEFLRNICTLEDPVEALLPGISQSQIQPHQGFNYETGLKSLMRQDPDVIMVGEVRDRETAGTVFQASLTGHLVLSTFHAGRCSEAISRLLDMAIEPYILRSGIGGIIAQRLARRSLPSATTNDVRAQDSSTTYAGRFLLAERLSPEDPHVSEGILSRAPADELERLAVSGGLVSLAERARQAIDQRWTTREEIYRVLGEALD